MDDIDTLPDTLTHGTDEPHVKPTDFWELCEKLGTARKDWNYHCDQMQAVKQRLKALATELAARLEGEPMPVMVRLCGQPFLVTRLADGIDITPLNEIR